MALPIRLMHEHFRDVAEAYVDCLEDGQPPTAEPTFRALGNAVVPQVAEYVGRLIVAHAQGRERRE